MGDVQLSSAVSAVVSAFHSAVENVQNIRKKSNRFIRSEKTVKEKLLQETLETAEYQISERYSQHFREVGEQFAVGDGNCAHINNAKASADPWMCRCRSRSIIPHRYPDAVRPRSWPADSDAGGGCKSRLDQTSRGCIDDQKRLLGCFG